AGVIDGVGHSEGVDINRGPVTGIDEDAPAGVRFYGVVAKRDRAATDDDPASRDVRGIEFHRAVGEAHGACGHVQPTPLTTASGLAVNSTIAVHGVTGQVHRAAGHVNPAPVIAAGWVA